MNIMLYALLWLSFGLGHSITAKISVQKKLAPTFKYYRLCYNAFAAAHFLLVLYLGAALLSTELYPFLSAWTFPMKAVQLAGLMFVLLALTQYDLKEFSGIAALFNRKQSDKNTVDSSAAGIEPLNTEGLNHWVRHPLYTGVFIYFWGGAISPLGFYTALFGSVYLLIGAKHEETKLVRLYGDAYRSYQQRVPRFIPSLSQFKSTR